MPSPREIALKFNEGSKFDKSVESYDAEAGAPAGAFPMGRTQDVLANPSNPPVGSSMASNLKKG